MKNIQLKNKKYIKSDEYIVEHHLTKKQWCGKFAKEILKALGTGLVLFMVLSSPSGARRILRGLKDEWDSKNTRETLKRLEAKRFIAFHEQPDGTIEVRLTKQGEMKLEEWALEDLVIKIPKRWDRRWRIVAFDISEKRKKAREALREMLKHLGFYQLQKSLFVFPYPCEAEIMFLKEMFHIPAWEVIYFSTDIIPQEKILKGKFGIK
jgi:hypothetical protein